MLQHFLWLSKRRAEVKDGQASRFVAFSRINFKGPIYSPHLSAWAPVQKLDLFPENSAPEPTVCSWGRPNGGANTHIGVSHTHFLRHYKSQQWTFHIHSLSRSINRPKTGEPWQVWGVWGSSRIPALMENQVQPWHLEQFPGIEKQEL